MTPQGAPLERGFKLGKYEVIGRISVGGMAELYLAYLAGQGGFRKFVALKRVLPAAAQQESFLKMFLDEARITAALSHANIAQVYELAENPENEEPVLAMEFVAGQNLAQVARRAKARNVELPAAFSCRVIHDVLLGLHSAHHFVEPTSGRPMPVIHRDINPRNIMVTYTGGTKIIDFGIAKARGRLDTTQVGMVKGTLQYMSPEQVMLKEVDGRSDLFATSVVLYELLSGKRLFDEPSDAALLNRIVQGDVPALGSVAPALPTKLVEVVMKGLARNAEDRWRSGRDYARALDQAVPELFDDEQVAELLGRLFEDKIAITRSLLQSTTTDASFANLKLMTQSGDDPESRPAMAPPQPIVDVPTSPARPKLADEGPAATSLARPPASAADAPTEQGRRRLTGEPPSTAATMIMDGPPVSSAPAPASDRTEANLDPVEAAAPAATLAADEGPTSPERPRVPAEAPPAPSSASGEARRQTGGVPARKRTLDGQLPGRKPTAEAQPAARKPTGDGAPARKLTGERPVVRVEDAPDATTDPAAQKSAGPEELLPVRRATADARVLAPVSGQVTTEPGAPESRSWALWAVLGVVVLTLLAALGLYASSGGPAPEQARPLQPAPPRPLPQR